MAIPTSYTEETFAAYLRHDVLQAVADILEWEVKTPRIVLPAIPIAVVAAVNANASDIQLKTTSGDALAIRDDFGVGTRINFTGDPQEYRVAQVYVNEGDAANLYARVTLFPFLKQARAINDTGTYELGYVADEDHAAYGIITRETLLALGYNSISEVTGTENIIRLRMQGRVEAWRFVQATTAALGSAETQEGNFFSRAQVYYDARDQRIFAEQDMGRRFGLTVSNNPEFYTTTNTKVVARW